MDASQPKVLIICSVTVYTVFSLTVQNRKFWWQSKTFYGNIMVTLLKFIKCFENTVQSLIMTGDYDLYCRPAGWFCFWGTVMSTIFMFSNTIAWEVSLDETIDEHCEGTENRVQVILTPRVTLQELRPVYGHTNKSKHTNLYLHQW